MTWVHGIQIQNSSKEIVSTQNLELDNRERQRLFVSVCLRDKNRSPFLEVLRNQLQ